MKVGEKKRKYIKPKELLARDLLSDLNLKLEKGTEENILNKFAFPVNYD